MTTSRFDGARFEDARLALHRAVHAEAQRKQGRHEKVWHGGLRRGTPVPLVAIAAAAQLEIPIPLPPDSPEGSNDL